MSWGRISLCVKKNQKFVGIPLLCLRSPLGCARALVVCWLVSSGCSCPVCLVGGVSCLLFFLFLLLVAVPVSSLSWLVWSGLCCLCGLVLCTRSVCVEHSLPCGLLKNSVCSLRTVESALALLYVSKEELCTTLYTLH